MSNITTTISTNNNLDYLKLALKSVRQNAYYKDMPIIVHAENCTDGTDEWLKTNPYDIEYHIDHNNNPKGIGGGMDFCVSRVQTEFVNIIHSDMWIAPNQDLELLKLYDGIGDTRLIASSFRIQPRIFVNDPDYRPGTVFVDINDFGAYAENFDSNSFDEWSTEFSQMNDNLEVRKAGGAGFFCRTEDYKWIGGNDDLFRPASWEDKDLFIRMQLEGYEFRMIPQSVLWHFSARGSHFRDEAKDKFHMKSKRQQEAEQNNMRKFVGKWGRLPEEDDATFVKPIHGTDTETRIKWSYDE